MIERGRHVTHMGKMRMYTKIQLENLNGRKRLRDLDAECRIILNGS